jgi:hypothetical protein
LKGVFIQTKGTNRTKQNKAKVLLLLMFSAIDTIKKNSTPGGVKHAEIIKKDRKFYGFRNKAHDQDSLPIRLYQPVSGVPGFCSA